MVAETDAETKISVASQAEATVWPCPGEQVQIAAPRAPARAERIGHPGLTHIDFQSYNRDVAGLLMLLGYDTEGTPDPKYTIQLDLQPPYQRGAVWGLKRRRNLIKSMLQGIPTGAVFLNHRGYADFAASGFHFRCVDGQQRLTTMAKFVEGVFSVPAAWWNAEKVNLDDPDVKARFDDPDGELGFADLSLPGKRWIMDRPMPTHETTFATVEEEGALFELINHGGVPAQASADDDLI